MSRCTGACHGGFYGRCDCGGDNEAGYCESQRRGGGGCLTYIFTGNVGNCPMLPVWRAIGRFFGIIR
jgi:hypothetical protein